MERGLRPQPPEPFVDPIGTGRRRRPDGKGIATSGRGRGCFRPGFRRRRRPDGKGIATCAPVRHGPSATLSAPTARWKGDCDVNPPGGRGPGGPSAPTARWKGDCDVIAATKPVRYRVSRRRRPDGKGIATSTPCRSFHRILSVGADGPMERGLRPPLVPHRLGRLESAPTARWKGDCDLRHFTTSQPKLCRRRRPDGKGIATAEGCSDGRGPTSSAPTARWKGDCDVRDLGNRLGKILVGAAGPMERGLRRRRSPRPRQRPTSAPTARWKGDCDNWRRDFASPFG